MSARFHMINKNEEDKTCIIQQTTVSGMRPTKNSNYSPGVPAFPTRFQMINPTINLNLPLFSPEPSKWKQQQRNELLYLINPRGLWWKTLDFWLHFTILWFGFIRRFPIRLTWQTIDPISFSLWKALSGCAVYHPSTVTFPPSFNWCFTELGTWKWVVDKGLDF